MDKMKGTNWIKVKRDQIEEEMLAKSQTNDSKKKLMRLVTDDYAYILK